jgi:beta-N-acetylhexosaminidase
MIKPLPILSILLFFTISASLKAQDSLDIKIGQMILIGFPKPEVDQAVLDAIRHGKIGSIILFEKNIPPKNSYHALKKITWTYQKAASIPLIIAIDQEGGRVNRLKEKYGFPRSLTAAKLGKMPLDSIQFYSETTAATLAGLGINMNFAPDVDLAVNPDNPVIVKAERAYSKSADSVVLFAREFIRQHQRHGVLTSIKHFPGHGSSMDDTHHGIADVTQTWSEEELKPYQTLIDEGYAESVMTSHIVNKKLDATGNPGTLSYDIIDGILRKKLNFQGVVFTDDMQMHAITQYYGLEEAIRLTILAGVDILTFSNNISGSQDRTVDKVHSIIRSYVENGIIPRERIEESFRRIMELKRRLSTTTSDYYRKNWTEAKNESDQLKIIIENQKKQIIELKNIKSDPADSGKKKKRTK